MNFSQDVSFRCEEIATSPGVDQRIDRISLYRRQRKQPGEILKGFPTLLKKGIQV
jgi:hypothetical protein